MSASLPAAAAHTGLPLTPPAAPRRLLVVEDEVDLARLLQMHLADLPAEVELVHDGLLALQKLRGSTPYDLVVLDVRLPRLSGLDLCRTLRAEGNTTPVLMLTARATELDRVLGLELGADDYVTKPFSVLEVIARVKALLRRAATPPAASPARTSGEDSDPPRIDAGPLSLDRLQRRAWLSGNELALTTREFALLWHFASHPGRAFSRAELLASVWGYGHDGYDHTVNTHINRVRNKLAQASGGAGELIQTVWGVGYRLVDEVTA